MSETNKSWTPLKFEHKRVACQNQDNFLAMMEILELGQDEGRFGLVYGPAGRGKSRTTAAWAANNGSVHLLMLPIWNASELGFLQALCRELGLKAIPLTKNDCFAKAVDLLVAQPRPVFLDEMDLAPRHLNLVRVLAELTGAAFVLIGENELPAIMSQNKRVWSRVFQVMNFEPAAPRDIITYGREAAGLEVEAASAAELNRSPGGEDWRVIKRTMIDVVGLCNAKKTRIVTAEIMRQAIKMGFRGAKR
jgi:DNA transposition AAA+ family ATPase